MITIERPTTQPRTVTDDHLWLGQFIYLDDDTYVHISRSKEQAYRALADQGELTTTNGEAVEQAVRDQYGDSDMVDVNVLPVDSTELGGDRDGLWLAQLIGWDGDTFVHIAGTKERAFRALADREGLTVGQGQSAETVVNDALGDSGETRVIVAPVDGSLL